MKFIDLFSGIGGFRTGMEMNGHECVAFCEIDKYARQSYKAMYDTTNEEELHDITKWTDEHVRQFVRDRGHIDVICGGFPCQSFSIAGKRGGFDDTRGTLFFEIMRIASIVRPRYLFLENVKGLLNHDGGATFETILNTLDEAGYDAEWQVLNSKDFGVPQNRERVFIIGHLRGSGGRTVFPVGGAYTKTKINIVGTTKIRDDAIGQREVVLGIDGLAGALTATDYKGPKRIIQPVLTPDRIEKRQNGRRLKEDGEPMFTLTSQDRHGILTYDLVQKVRVRKHEVNVSKLKKLLRAHKESSSLTNKQIAELTGEPLTLVEHWFRRDNSFSIPGEDVWFELKDLLGVTTTDFDAPITEFVEKDNEFEKSNRVYGSEGIAPTLTRTSSDEKIIHNYKIRKLTPLECWRLQGFTDEQFYKAKNDGVSNSQLYKQAGNSVTVNVIDAIARKLI